MPPTPLRHAGAFLPVFVSAALLAALAAFGRIQPERPPVSDDYFDQVGAAVDAIPYRVEGWIGVDMEPSPAAVRLLRPNRILQRRYSAATGGEPLTLLVVHCGDVRDMVGHYPPVCYPAQGWKLENARPAPLDLYAQGVGAMLYRFSRDAGGAKERIAIVNFFMLPGEQSRFASDMESLTRAAGDTAAVRLGAAQIQVVAGCGDDEAAILPGATELLKSLEKVAVSMQVEVEK